MRGPGSKAGFLFKLVIPATSVFAITVLSMIAVLFSNQQAPLAQLLNKYGNTLLAAEFFAVIVLALLAMTVDRIQTLRQLKLDEQSKLRTIELVDQPSDANTPQ